MNEKMKITISDEKTMVDIVALIVEKGLTFEVKESDRGYVIVLTGGF